MSYSKAIEVVEFYENNKDIVEINEEYEEAKEVINWYENTY